MKQAGWKENGSSYTARGIGKIVTNISNIKIVDICAKYNNLKGGPHL